MRLLGKRIAMLLLVMRPWKHALSYGKDQVSEHEPCKYV